MGARKNPFLIGHRGARRMITENTLESILLAFDYGATHAEIDIRKTADGKLAVFHWPTTFRFNRKFWFINRTKMEDIEKMSLRKGGKLTTLNNLLSVMKDKPGKLVIETKILGLEEEIIELIDKYNFWQRAILWSFKHQSIKTFTRLCGRKVQKAILITLRPFSPKDILKRALDCGADFVYPVFRNLNIDFFRKNGIGLIKLYESESKARHFLEQGGQGIMTPNLSALQNLAKQFY